MVVKLRGIFNTNNRQSEQTYSLIHIKHINILNDAIGTFGGHNAQNSKALCPVLKLKLKTQGGYRVGYPIALSPHLFFWPNLGVVPGTPTRPTRPKCSAAVYAPTRGGGG
jgi:hypothetical protein